MDKYYEAALKFCQSEGYEGSRLPRFRPGRYSSENCPITVALDLTYWHYTAGGRKDGTVIVAPEELANDIAIFVIKVDNGEYSELGKPTYIH